MNRGREFPGTRLGWHQLSCALCGAGGWQGATHWQWTLQDLRRHQDRARWKGLLLCSGIFSIQWFNSLFNPCSLLHYPLFAYPSLFLASFIMLVSTNFSYSFPIIFRKSNTLIDFILLSSWMSEAVWLHCRIDRVVPERTQPLLARDAPWIHLFISVRTTLAQRCLPHTMDEGMGVLGCCRAERVASVAGGDQSSRHAQGLRQVCRRPERHGGHTYELRHLAPVLPCGRHLRCVRRWCALLMALLMC